MNLEVDSSKVCKISKSSKGFTSVPAPPELTKGAVKKSEQLESEQKSETVVVNLALSAQQKSRNPPNKRRTRRRNKRK